MTDNPSRPAGRLSNGRFLPGHSMGGRPPGARNRVSAKMLLAILKDFETHQEVLLDRLRSSYTPSYFNTLARMLPHMAQTETSDFDDYSDAQAARLVVSLRQTLAVNPNPRVALSELEAVLASGPGVDSSGANLAENTAL